MVLIKRNCSICEKKIEIRLNKDKTYSGGNYFGKIKDKEYWECNKCFKKV